MPGILLFQAFYLSISFKPKEIDESYRQNRKKAIKTMMAGVEKIRKGSIMIT